jgi:uncharacterized short protein YbdD (DUF466 family)
VPEVLARLETLVAALRDFVRGAAGPSYERYLEHHARCHAGEATLSRGAYHAREVARRWNGVNRCC